MIRHNRSSSVNGAWEVKRRFRLPGLSHERDAQVVTEWLGRLPGVLATKPDVGRRRLQVVYDITRTDYLQVLEALEQAGFPVSGGRWARLKANWFQYRDRNSRVNRAVPGAPVGSNPKDVVQ